VAESAANRYFSAISGTNVPSEALVFLRRILPVFVLLAPYGNPGSTLEDRRSAGSVEVVSGIVLQKQLTPRSVGHSRDQLRRRSIGHRFPILMDLQMPMMERCGNSGDSRPGTPAWCRARQPTRPYCSDRGGSRQNARNAACSAVQSLFCYAAAPSDADIADALG
jgi:hypothetical protein